MGDKIDILKIVLDFFKGNKVLLLIVTSVLTSSTAGFFSGVKYSKIAPVAITAPAIINQKCNCNKEIAQLKAKITELEKLKRWH